MKKKTILIADDEPHILELMKLILNENFNVLTASNGLIVLEIVKKTKPDLILLDVMMPGINGYEICEKLKKDSETKNIIIAMISAKTQEKDIMEGLRLGADYYLTKPFDPSVFEKKINQMLK